MQESRKREEEAIGAAAQRLFSLLPIGIARELWSLSCGRVDFLLRMEELRLRAGGRCAAVIAGVQRPLCRAVSPAEMEEFVCRLLGGARYAYEDCIAEGYLPFDGGIRIGLCGRARYEGDRMTGVCEIGSVVIRFPHASVLADPTLLLAMESARQGLLIHSPPGAGKTTALRTLALWLGRMDPPRRVVIVDERMELAPEAFIGATVDVLRGYRRVQALQVAHRCLNPEVVMIDEIGGEEEAEGMAALLRGGAIAVATAHAASREDLMSRGVLRPFFRLGVFDTLLGIKRAGASFVYSMERIDPLGGLEEKCSAILA